MSKKKNGNNILSGRKAETQRLVLEVLKVKDSCFTEILRELQAKGLTGSLKFDHAALKQAVEWLIGGGAVEQYKDQFGLLFRIKAS